MDRHRIGLLVEGRYCVRFAYEDLGLTFDLSRLGAVPRPHAPGHMTLEVTAEVSAELLRLSEEHNIEIDRPALDAMEITICAPALRFSEALAERQRKWYVLCQAVRAGRAVPLECQETFPWYHPKNPTPHPQ